MVLPGERGWNGDPDVEQIRSTDAKKLFGALLDKAIAGARVVITRHDAPKAVLIGFREFEALTRGEGRSLDALSEAFNSRLDRMQTAKARVATKAAFDASPKRLGKAAVKTARTRG